jgi:hypothetical protein
MQVRPLTPILFGRGSFAGRVRLAVHPTALAYLPWALFVIALISYYYVFLASAGRFTDLPTQLDYYDQMAEGFRHGHLYVTKAPVPQLLASSNPFDSKFFPVWLWDASLYNGHYYMYWGPVPGLALWAYKVVTRTYETITDQWITTILMLGRLYAGAALILSLASRARFRQPVWAVCLAIAVFGLANPTPFTVARPHIYEGSLTGAQCFLFWGIVAAFWGIELKRWRRLLFTLASVAWGLAVGCRATAFVAVPLLVLVSAGFAWRGVSPSWKERIADLLALGLPAAFASIAYGVYNYARFGSPTEFGVHYQVTLQPFFGRPSYVLPNLYAYLFEPVDWSCRFPFVRIRGDRPPVNLFPLPAGYRTFERVGGILLTGWWCWLVLLWVGRNARRLASRTRNMASAALPNLTDYEVWASLCAIACVLSMVPVLTLWEASMRYVGDALGGLLVLGAFAAFGLLQRGAQSGRRWHSLARAFVVVLGVQTCVIGAFAAFTAYDDPLKTHNPVLYKKLERSLSLCDRPFPQK